jgi:hypothetical protein
MFPRGILKFYERALKFPPGGSIFSKRAMEFSGNRLKNCF